ncbi:hypothetical protein [Streptomyces chromofuscus]|uniref:Secreted protein n=1 Tax=Streptomyces chromofuscus TaxID=42881 RepID=A0A7M2T560_STRCW|nr:hypothetical protein [Streptomyces chromofuscus]QOV43820.1 hypothetical protein IPT68_29695 [Streptomyces chromofuscus]GGT21603.1 hypothetical protein GCM10010254_47690 [Streptomyces chromofuscus]
MSKLIRRVATSAVSAALAGIALVGTAGSASAEPLPAPGDRQGVGVTERRATVGNVPVRDDGRYYRDGRRHDRNDQWRRHDGVDDHGFRYYDHDRRHHYRYDGHRLVRRVGGTWVVVVVTDRRHAVDWYLDQLRFAGRYDSHRG